MICTKRTVFAIFALAAIAFSTLAFSQQCGLLTNSYVPFDYRTSAAQLQIVEGTHFTPDIEALRHAGTGPFGGDLDYTLRTSPNHHRALNSMMNLVMKTHSDPPPGSRYTMDCWFDRAMRFAANDGTVRMLYGIYLSRTGKKQDALARFKEAQQLGGDSPNLDYNLGLAYFELKDYDNAMDYARRAYDQGISFPGLRQKLKDVGKWMDLPAPSGPTRESGANGPAKEAQ